MLKALSTNLNICSTYRVITAFFLAGIILFAVSIKSVHHIFAHSHDEHHHSVCEAADPSWSYYFHDDEHSDHSCHICELPFLQLPLEYFSFQEQTIVHHTVQQFLMPKIVYYSPYQLPRFLRGPPLNF